MKYLLDTSVCVEYLRGKNSLVRHRFAAHPASDLCVCPIVVAELYYGAGRSADPAGQFAHVSAFLAPYTSLPFDDATAGAYVQHRLALEAIGQMIGHFDLMIAAIALVHRLTVVTHNTKDFARVPGLTLEDWEVP